MTGEEEARAIREVILSGNFISGPKVEAFERESAAYLGIKAAAAVNSGTAALHVALAHDTPVAAWMASYLPWRFYFRHVEDGVHIDFHNLSASAWNERKAKALTVSEQHRLDAFLAGRYHKHVSFDMKLFKEYKGDTAELRTRLGLDGDKPVWATRDGKPLGRTRAPCDWCADFLY